MKVCHGVGKTSQEVCSNGWIRPIIQVAGFNFCSNPLTFLATIMCKDILYGEESEQAEREKRKTSKSETIFIKKFCQLLHCGTKGKIQFSSRFSN